MGKTAKLIETITGMRKLTPNPVSSKSISAIASAPQAGAADEVDAISQLRLHLSFALQTSLETQEILTTFATHCQALFNICGLAFTASDPELNTRIGETAIHHFNYTLSTANNDIGELCLYSRNRLNESEIMLMEIAASCTVYPLQNAKRYHNAVANAHRQEIGK